MTTEKYDELLQIAMEQDKQDLIGKKAIEYSKGNDRFYNFKSIAKMRNATSHNLNDKTDTFNQLWNLMLKQFVCIQTWIDDKTIPTYEMAFEKIGDVRKYLYNLEIMYIEQREYDKQYIYNNNNDVLQTLEKRMKALKAEIEKKEREND